MTSHLFAAPPPGDAADPGGRIDLHTHSLRSDGTDEPADLVGAAAAAGLSVLALTDHDTHTGLPEAAARARELGIGLVAGIEVSTRNQGAGQHLLVYGMDRAASSYDRFARLVDHGVAGREGRVAAIVAALNGAGIDLTVADVAAAAGTSIPGRPHVADALVAAGVCRDRAEAFDRFLGTGKVAHVRRPAPDIVDVVAAATAAGGLPVIAHPWGRGNRVSEERLAELAQAGMVGVEVDHQEHGPGERDALRGIAANLGLVLTGSSDHHGTGKVDHDLGCNTTDPGQFARLVEIEAHRTGEGQDSSQAASRSSAAAFSRA